MAKILAGISFPFRIENQGLPAQALGTDVIKSCLVTLLKTEKGSRVMRPTLGTNLKKLLFENSGPFLSSLIRREIITAVRNELPMVQISQIDIKELDHSVFVDIQYFIYGIPDQVSTDLPRAA